MQVLEVSDDLLCYVAARRQPTLASIAEADGERGCVGATAAATSTTAAATTAAISTTAAATTSHNEVRCKTGSRGSGPCRSVNTT